MIVLRLAFKSLLSRRVTALLTVFAIAVSVMLFLGVEKVRTGARAGFANTIAGTDLIVGARSGAIQLLLYSVFRIGNATNNITWASYSEIVERPEVAWAVPLSLGDNHRGFRVLGTTSDYFRHYRFRRNQPITFESGKPFDDLFDAVLGADVASALGYTIGERIIIAHGAGSVSFLKHDDKPFRVSGIVARTGTPIDRTVHVSLEAIEAMHVDWRGGAPTPGYSISAEKVRGMALQPKAVTAALIGLKSKLAIFRLQRFINEYRREPLLAILPGVALQELWQLVGQAEIALGAVSAMVVLTAFVGMVTMILSTLNERRREMAILRSVGAGPRTILGLLLSEALLLTLAGVLLGCLALYFTLLVVRGYINTGFGLYIPVDPPNVREWVTLLSIVFAGLVAGLLPALRAYWLSLADGMLVRN